MFRLKSKHHQKRCLSEGLQISGCFFLQLPKIVFVKATPNFSRIVWSFESRLFSLFFIAVVVGSKAQIFFGCSIHFEAVEGVLFEDEYVSYLVNDWRNR